jgi:hypothetical protein
VINNVLKHRLLAWGLQYILKTLLLKIGGIVLFDIGFVKVNDFFIVGQFEWFEGSMVELSG